MTTYIDGVSARQFEQHITGMIAASKVRLQLHLDARDTEAMKAELKTLMALEACRRHALAAYAELTDEAAAGYRIINNFLEARQ